MKNFSEIIEKVFAGFKKLTPMLVTIMAASAALLFAPDKLLQKAYLIQFKDDYGPYVGIVFLISIILVLLLIIIKIGEGIRTSAAEAKLKKIHIKNLLSLNPVEKGILIDMYNEASHSAVLSLADSTTNLLERKQIIGRGSNISSMYGDDIYSFSYFLQPWVIRYLDKHPEFFGS